MSFSGDKPKGSSKISENSSQMAYQWDELVEGIDIEFRLDYYIPSYFAQISSGIFMG